MVELAPLALRTVEAARDAVDAKLGWGTGLSVDDAFSRLTGPEQVEWMLGELMHALAGRSFHIFEQHFAWPDLPTDWPARYAAVVELARDVDPTAVDLLRWVLARAARRRDGTGGEPMVSCVPEVALGEWPRLVALREVLVARWPDTLSPDPLPTPRPFMRTVTPAASSEPRYPSARVGYTARGASCPRRAPANVDAVITTTLAALWAAGASDDALDAAFEAFGSAGRALPAALAAWVAFDGGAPAPEQLAELGAALFPRHPIEAALGLEALSFPSLALLSEVHAPLRAKLVEARFVDVFAAPEAPVAQRLRWALRLDPDGLCLSGTDVTAEVAEAVLRVLETGHVVAVFGASPELEGLRSRARELGIPVVGDL